MTSRVTCAKPWIGPRRRRTARTRGATSSRRRFWSGARRRAETRSRRATRRYRPRRAPPWTFRTSPRCCGWPPSCGRRRLARHARATPRTRSRLCSTPSWRTSSGGSRRRGRRGKKTTPKTSPPSHPRLEEERRRTTESRKTRFPARTRRASSAAPNAGRTRSRAALRRRLRGRLRNHGRKTLKTVPRTWRSRVARTDRRTSLRTPSRGARRRRRRRRPRARVRFRRADVGVERARRDRARKAKGPGRLQEAHPPRASAGRRRRRRRRRRRAGRARVARAVRHGRDVRLFVRPRYPRAARERTTVMASDSSRARRSGSAPYLPAPLTPRAESSVSPVSPRGDAERPERRERRSRRESETFSPPEARATSSVGALVRFRVGRSTPPPRDGGRTRRARSRRPRHWRGRPQARRARSYRRGGAARRHRTPVTSTETNAGPFFLVKQNSIIRQSASNTSSFFFVSRNRVRLCLFSHRKKRVRVARPSK